MKRAVVTGGSGFLGSHVADSLTDRGLDVTVLDLAPSRWLRPGLELVVGDVLDERLVHEAVEGASYVFHLAGLADLNVATSRPLETARFNVLGTVNVLEAARAASVERFLFASTVYVYSRAGGFYRTSKQACEAYVDEYRRQFGLPYTILRYGSLYGPRATDANGVYRLLRQAKTSGRVRHVGTPEDSREYVHVADAARLSADALAPEFENEHLVITGHHPMRLRDLFTMFSEILGRPIDVDYVEDDGDRGHYAITPYSYAPRPARKLTSNLTYDMGEGIIRMLEEMDAGDRA